QTTLPDAPVKLGLGNASYTSAQAGSCNPVIAQTQDQFGNAIAKTVNTTVNLSGAGGVPIGFFSNPGCTTPITSVTIPADQTGSSLYFKGIVAGTAEIGLSDDSAVLSSG